jgi:outer membrane protein assembly factor BamB
MDSDGRHVTSVDTGRPRLRCASDEQGLLYVCHPTNPDPCVNRDGIQVRQVGVGQINYPFFIQVQHDRLYVTDYGSATYIYRTDGNFIRKLATAMKVNPISSRGLFVDLDGYVLVGDSDNKCIYVYDEDGSHIHTLKDEMFPDIRGFTLTSSNELVVKWESKSIIVCR